MVVISKFKIKEEDYITYSLTNTDFFINVKNKCHGKFLEEFDYYILTVFDENKNPSYFLNYDNLIHLSMIVKDAGDNFENVLIKNFPFFDRWTILDTGSTDNTIDIIKKVMNRTMSQVTTGGHRSPPGPANVLFAKLSDLRERFRIVAGVFGSRLHHEKLLML